MGYYKLTREKKKASDWVYIIDNSIQVGKHKCLLILGFRLSQLPKMRALTFEDMEPLALEIHEEVNTEILHGSSEIIESLFGKLKDLGKLDSTKGFTSLVLAAAACVGKTDEAVVVKAMENCRLSEIKRWTQKAIGKTVQSKRRCALKPINVSEQIFGRFDLIPKMDGVFREETERIAV